MQNRLIRIAFAAAMTTLGTAQLASATPITWIITGPVSSSTGSWSALFPVGTIANLSVTWEPDTLNPPDCPPGSGRYLAVKAAAAPLSILSHSAAYGGGAIEVNAPDGNCNPAAGTGVWFHLFQLSQAGPPGGFSFQLGIRVLGADPNAPTLPLIMAGVFETAFATCLGKMKTAEGAVYWYWLAGFIVCLAVSMLLLFKASQTLPIGTAYAVWTGIGAVGTVIVGIIFFKEPADFWRLFFLFTLIASIAGLKFFTK